MRSSLIWIIKEFLLPVVMTLMILHFLFYHFHMMLILKLLKNTRNIICVSLNHTYTHGSMYLNLTYISTALFIFLYSGVSNYVELYGSGLFKFRFYVNLPNLFAWFLGFDIIHLSHFYWKFFLIFLYYNKL